MGDRISIQFTDGRRSSVALFAHWDGMEFLDNVNKYLKEYRAAHKEGVEHMPLDRFEPNTVMLDFIVYLVGEEVLNAPVTHNYYLGKDENGGDNSDNGNHVFDRNGEIESTKAIEEVDEN